VFAVALGFIINVVAVMPVFAAVAGDELTDPIPIPATDFGVPQSYDSTGATTNELTDPASCQGEFGTLVGPFTETVWHSFTPSVAGELIVDINSFPDPEAPGFLAILFVVADDGAGGTTPVGCSAFPSTVRFSADAGQTYYAMTGSLPETPGGGPAEIIVAEPFISGLAVDSVASYDAQKNEVTVTGTLVCEDADFVEVFIDARQQVGQHAVMGGGATSISPCDGEASWTVTLTGFTTFFNPGAIEVGVNVFSCATFCMGDFLSTTVQAHPISNKPGPPPPPPPPAPDNDEREGAIGISLGETAEQDVSSATANPGDPGQCPDEPVTDFSGHTVWYAFSAEADGWVEVNTIGSTYDTTLFVLDGEEIVACDDDIVIGFDQRSQLTFLATSGTTYDIMVGSWRDSPPGQLVLNVLEGTEPPSPPTPPANDESADAIPLAVGETLTGDTSAATISDTDPDFCPHDFISFTNHTVWYTVTPEDDGWLEINTFGSEFDTTLHVLAGGEVIACNNNTQVSLQSRVVFFAEAGVTYEVMVGSSFADGGPLVISALAAEPPLQVSLTLDELGTVDTRTGEAIITGTVTCTEEAVGAMGVFVSQTGGRFTAEGGNFAEIACGPEPTAWSVTVAGDTAKFQAGEADVFGDVFVSTGPDESAFTFFEGQVTLRPLRSAQ
jgi:hypothetical protein